MAGDKGLSEFKKLLVSYYEGKAADTLADFLKEFNYKEVKRF